MVKSNYYSFRNYSFKGTGVFSILIGLILPIGIILDNGVKALNWFFIIVLFFSAFMFIMGASQLYYLKLNEKELIIKNLILFWYEKKHQRHEVFRIIYYSKGGGKSFKEGIKIHYLEESKETKLFLMNLYSNEFWEKMELKLKYYKYPFDGKY